MAGPQSAAERAMMEMIRFLLALPEEERTMMSQAVPYRFTRESPAPKLGIESSQELPGLLCTLGLGSVEAASHLLGLGLRPAVLNFAHGYNCGGGFEHAGGSLSEDVALPKPVAAQTRR